MATARKLPSGNYRVRVYVKTTGKYKSFTASSKREADRMASDYLEINYSLTPKPYKYKLLPIKNVRQRCIASDVFYFSH